MISKILVLAHASSRTGAPLVLATFLRWLKAEHGIELVFLLQHGGPIEEDYRQLGPVHRLHRDHIPESLLDGVDLIYANTSTNGYILDALARSGLPAVTHVHELAHELGLNGAVELERLRRHSDRFIACSQAVVDSLGDELHIPSDRISLVHEAIETGGAAATTKAEVREKLGITDPKVVVVAGAGTISWRKGSDLFLQIIAPVVERCRQAGVRPLFCWFGKAGGDIDELRWGFDLARSGAGEFLHFVGEVDRLQDYLPGIDIFCLTSREDPFPLVMLESGAAGAPLVAFAQSGGAEEFVASAGGRIAAYLDVQGYAEQVADLAVNRDARTALGEQAARAVREHYDISVQGPKLLEAMLRAVEETDRPRADSMDPSPSAASRLSYPLGTGELVVRTKSSQRSMPLKLLAGAPHQFDLPLSQLFSSEDDAGFIRVRLAHLVAPGPISISGFEIRSITNGELFHDFLKGGLGHSDDLLPRQSDDALQQWVCSGPNASLQTKPWECDDSGFRDASLRLSIEVAPSSPDEIGTGDAGSRSSGLLRRMLGR